MSPTYTCVLPLPGCCNVNNFSLFQNPGAHLQAKKPYGSYNSVQLSADPRQYPCFVPGLD